MGDFAAATPPDVEEFRIFGPPGTGKTNFIGTQVVKDSGTYSPDDMVLASFTNSAARTIASRLDEMQVSIPEENVGTLHSIANHAIGRPKVVVDRLGDWNAFCPRYAFKGVDDTEVAPIGKGFGDDLYAQYQVLRARMRPRETWPSTVIAFANEWERWKSEAELIDFTDMIEFALRDTDTAPGNPRVGYFDETQDFTALELALVRKWGSKMDRVYLAGDDDQTVYSWLGATPNAFLQPEVPARCKRVLKQSWRVPHAVHAYSQEWIQQVAYREPKEYLPRDHPGQVIRVNVRWKCPEEGLAILDKALAANKTIMILATCNYMLQPLISLFRAHGYPFHNPYSRASSSWNPLSPTRGTGIVDRLAAFKRPDERIFGERSQFWTGRDLWLWAEMLNSKQVMVAGGKKKLDELKKYTEEVTWDMLQGIFQEQFWPALFDMDLGWLYEYARTERAKSMAYPYQIVRRFGFKKLLEKPQITTGTIHSVKGAEAQVVLLWPDLSTAGMSAWLTRGESRDSIVRLFYVAFTRASETLLIGQQSTKYAVTL